MSGCRSVCRRNAAAPVFFFNIFVRRFFLGDISFADGPVDQHHADQDGADDAAGCAGERKIFAGSPAEFIEHRAESACGAMSAFEADRQDGTEQRVDMKKRSE